MSRLFRYRVGQYSDRLSFYYYKKRGTYKGLPRILEILVGGGYKGWTLRQALSKYRWVKR